MEPRIQYAKTSDDVSIAFWTLGDGEGDPLIVMPNLPMSHVELEWRIPEYRSWYEQLGADRQLVRYDNRGSGLSDREVADYSLDAHLRDLETVADKLGFERFALMAPLFVGPIAITFAARKPERLSHLILWCTFARSADYEESSAAKAIIALRDKDWEIYTEAVAHIALGWEAGAPARQFASLMRECVTRDAALALWGAMASADASPLLPQVKAPTLVVHRRDVSFPPVELSRELASRIPDARHAVLEGESLAPFLGDTEAVADAVIEFLREGQEPHTGPIRAHSGAVHTILFTDIEDSTVLTQRLGDENARVLLREHERITRRVLKVHGGNEVKTMGDGFMASFGSVTKAVECAIDLQRAFSDRNESADESLRVRVGVNAGEPIEEEGDLFGSTVILASRIAAKAEGGEILVADTVRGLCSGRGSCSAIVVSSWRRGSRSRCACMR